MRNPHKITPLAYMLDIINDPAAEPARRDRMAVAAAPYVHAKPAALRPIGKKRQQAEAAKTAGGDEWGDDLRWQQH